MQKNMLSSRIDESILKKYFVYLLAIGGRGGGW